MNATFKAVRGGIARRRLQTVVVALVVLVSTAATVLALALVVDSSEPFNHAFSAQKGADIVAAVDPSKASAAQLAGTARLHGVSATAGPFREVTVAARSDGQRLPPLTLVGRSSQSGPVDDLVVSEGHWATGPGQVVLVTGTEGDLGFSVGSRVTVGSGSHRQTLTVVGLANSVTGSASGWVVPAEIPALQAAGGVGGLQMLYRFTHAGGDAALRADVRSVAAALPRGAIEGTMSYTAAQRREDGNIAPFVPFLIAFGVLGMVMSVLIVANVVGGAVVAGYRRIGILKSIGFTPVQVAVAYAAQVAVPALIGCVLGVVLGDLLAVPLLKQNADVYGVGHLGVPVWVDVGVPLAMCALAAVAGLLPALRAGRLSTVQAIATGRAPRSGRGYSAHRVLGRAPLPRPVTIGLAAPFARPARSFLTLAAVLLGATALTFALGLNSSLGLVVDGLSHDNTEPVQIQMPGERGVGPKVVGGPGRGAAASPSSPAAAQRAILTAVHAQPGTLHVVAEADESVSVAGVSDSVPVAAFRGPSGWTGYDLVSGRWYSGPGEIVVPTGFLNETGTSVGDRITISDGGRRERVRIVGEVFDTHDRGVNILTSWATLERIDPGLIPAQFDVALRPGTSGVTYSNALSRELGSAYYVQLNNRKSDVIEAMTALITTLSLMLAAVAALGVLNTVVLNTRERVHDLGVFKAIGMTPRQTVAMAISWVAGIGLVAGVLAIPLGIALHHEILPAMASSVGLRLPASFLDVYGGPELVALALAGVVIAVVGALLPAGWAAKVKTATALHAE